MPASDPTAPGSFPASARLEQVHSRLRAFTDAVAVRLPGTWAALVEGDLVHRPSHADLVAQLWEDEGRPVGRALGGRLDRDVAMLVGPADESLIALARPHCPGQFLVGAMRPLGTDDAWCRRPNGIAVPADPARAASDIDRRLLPRYRQAVEAVREPALAEAHWRARRALEDWDAVSDSYCDEQGFPVDEDAYGIRQARRDADAWRQFEVFLFHGRSAIDRAQAAAGRSDVQPAVADRWRYQLRALDDALAEGRQIRDAWMPQLVDRLAVADAAGFNDAVDTRNAEGWSAVASFIDHAPVLQAIQVTEQRSTAAGAVRVTAARARSATVSPGSTPRQQPPEGQPPAGPTSPPHRPSR